MKQGFFQEHWIDQDGNPTGGVSTGRGFTIAWQNGPLKKDGEPIEPNGAFVEDLIQVVIGRIEHYEDSQFACNENKMALMNLKAAAAALDMRTGRRIAEGTEGTHISSDSEGQVLGTAERADGPEEDWA